MAIGSKIYCYLPNGGELRDNGASKLSTNRPNGLLMVLDDASTMSFRRLGRGGKN
jgi:hypothetical protein